MTTPKDTWISVKDAMPKKDKIVLVFTSRGQMYFDYSSDGKCFYQSKSDPVLFWMLLSKPKNK